MNWYVVYTKRGQEGRAQVNLERQGISCYVPSIRIWKKVRGAMEVVVEPLFPRYLFVQLDPHGSGRSWSALRSTRGVTRLVSFGEEAAQVDERLIALLRSRESQSAIGPAFEEGAAVKITSGPFSGIEAVYLMSDGEGRAMVLVNLLSASAKLRLSLSHIKRLEPD